MRELRVKVYRIHVVESSYLGNLNWPSSEPSPPNVVSTRPLTSKICNKEENIQAWVQKPLDVFYIVTKPREHFASMSTWTIYRRNGYAWEFLWEENGAGGQQHVAFLCHFARWVLDGPEYGATLWCGFLWLTSFRNFKYQVQWTFFISIVYL